MVEISTTVPKLNFIPSVEEMPYGEKVKVGVYTDIDYGNYRFKGLLGKNMSKMLWTPKKGLVLYSDFGNLKISELGDSTNFNFSSQKDLTGLVQRVIDDLYTPDNFILGIHKLSPTYEILEPGTTKEYFSSDVILPQNYITVSKNPNE